MSSKPLTEQRRIIQETRLRAFACAYLSFAKLVTCDGVGSANKGRFLGDASARRKAAQVVGIRNDQTAKKYMEHAVVLDEMKKHFEAMMLKYKKSSDDVLDGIAKIAFPTDAVKPDGKMTYGDNLRALGMLAQHHKLINRASEGEEESGESIRVYIPDNKRNPTSTQVMLGVKFYDKPLKAIESKEDE